VATQPERIRAEIETTRADLANDLDRLADKTSPKRIVGLRLDSVRDMAHSARERVMGASENAASAVQGTAATVADGLREAPAALNRQTQGSPIAVGVIAFGAGLLASALIPATRIEQKIAEEIIEHAGPLIDPLREAGRDVSEEIGRSVSDAAGQVTQTVEEAAAHTAHQAKESALEVSDRTRQAMS